MIQERPARYGDPRRKLGETIADALDLLDECTRGVFVRMHNTYPDRSPRTLAWFDFKVSKAAVRRALLGHGREPTDHVGSILNLDTGDFYLCRATLW